MTPLANKLLKNKSFCSEPSRLSLLSEAHFFEVTELLGTMDAFSKSVYKMREADKVVSFNSRTFLPAPCTWIEWQVEEHQGIRALVLKDLGDGWSSCHIIWWIRELDTGTMVHLGYVSNGGDDFESPGGEYPEFLAPVETRNALLSAAHVFLAMINTPKVFGRRQKMPLFSQERRLAAAMGIQGRFPLRAWTELKLEVCVPKDMRGEEVKEAHLTGKKALHFCRAHLRFRAGQFEFVRSHWRGDASIGMKQTRYKVVPPKERAA